MKGIPLLNNRIMDLSYIKKNQSTASIYRIIPDPTVLHFIRLDVDKKKKKGRAAYGERLKLHIISLCYISTS